VRFPLHPTSIQSFPSTVSACSGGDRCHTLSRAILPYRANQQPTAAPGRLHSQHFSRRALPSTLVFNHDACDAGCTAPSGKHQEAFAPFGPLLQLPQSSIVPPNAILPTTRDWGRLPCHWTELGRLCQHQTCLLPSHIQLDYPLKSGVFRDATPCGSCKNQHFGGT
jgi:hypothetical protein